MFFYVSAVKEEKPTTKTKPLSIEVDYETGDLFGKLDRGNSLDAYLHNFDAPAFKDQGKDFTFVHLPIPQSVCTSYCENLIIFSYSLTNLVTRFTFGMKAHLIETHLLIPRSRSHFKKISVFRGISVSETQLVYKLFTEIVHDLTTQRKKTCEIVVLMTNHLLL